MYTGSFIAHIKTGDIYKDIAEDVKTRFDIFNFEIDRPLPKQKKSYLLDLEQKHTYIKENNDEDKKTKGTKNVIKRKLNFKIIKTV